MTPPKLGLRANLAQFALLVVVNAFVGAMVGMERTLLSPIAEQVFHLAAKTAVLTAASLVIGIASSFAAYFTFQAARSGNNMSAALCDPGA